MKMMNLESFVGNGSFIKMANCGSRTKKMKYGSKVKKMARGGMASDADRKALNELIGQISSGKKKKTPSGPPKMPKAVRNMRERSKSKGGAGEAGSGYVKMKGGGAAFPDLTGDGKVTKKDILRGRGVKGFEAGGAVCRGMGAAMRGGKYTGCK